MEQEWDLQNLICQESECLTGLEDNALSTNIYPLFTLIKIMCYLIISFS